MEPMLHQWSQCSIGDATVLKCYVNLFMLVVFIILFLSCQRCLSYNLATRWARTSMPNRPDTAHEHYFHRSTCGKRRAGASSLSYRYSVQCDRRFNRAFLEIPNPRSHQYSYVSERTSPNLSVPKFPNDYVIIKQVVNVQQTLVFIHLVVTVPNPLQDKHARTAHGYHLRRNLKSNNIEID